MAQFLPNPSGQGDHVSWHGGINGGQYLTIEDIIRMGQNDEIRWEPGVGWTNAPEAATPGATNPNNGGNSPVNDGPGEPFGAGITMEGETMGVGAPSGSLAPTFTDNRPPQQMPGSPAVNMTPDGPFGAEINIGGDVMGVGAPSQIDGGSYQFGGSPDYADRADLMPNQPVNPLTGELALDPNGNPWPWTLRDGYEPPVGFRPGDSPRGPGEGGGGGDGNIGGGTGRGVGIGHDPVMTPGQGTRINPVEQIMQMINPYRFGPNGWTGGKV